MDRPGTRPVRDLPLEPRASRRRRLGQPARRPHRHGRGGGDRRTEQRLGDSCGSTPEKASADSVRPATHEQPAASTDHGSPITDHPKPVLTGLDVLVRDNFKQLKGRRVGLITNHTGVDRDGRRNVDLLYNADGVELVAIFSPEHGIAGKLDHDGITDARDEATGLPIHSLYGETRKPTEKQLKGIDTLVFDIQDIGCRFYTYESTMAWAMEAAGEHGLKFVVLDRPNPIGGVAMEGPLADGGREIVRRLSHGAAPSRPDGRRVGDDVPR